MRNIIQTAFELLAVTRQVTIHHSHIFATAKIPIYGGPPDRSPGHLPEKPRLISEEDLPASTPKADRSARSRPARIVKLGLDQAGIITGRR